MKKSLIALLVACLLVTSCASTDKDSDATTRVNRANEWGDADISNLEDTKLSQQFKNQIRSVVYFELDSATPNSDALEVLGHQAEWLQKNPSAMIVVEGHCDERGTREYNFALGERRASVVRDYLALKGIDSRRIRTISYGKERPDAGALESNEESWAKNRRAVTVVN